MMNDFININTTAFVEAVTEATSTLQGDVTTLFDKVRALETDQNVQNTQFDSSDDQFTQRIVDIMCENIDDVVRNADLTSMIGDGVDMALNDVDWSDYVDNDTIADALGISRYDEIITDSSLSDHIDLSEYATKDDIENFIDVNDLHERMKDYFPQVASNDSLSPYAKDILLDLLELVANLTQHVTNLRTMCGLPNADLATTLPNLRKKIITN
jgi:hypothetical protein